MKNVVKKVGSMSADDMIRYHDMLSSWRQCSSGDNDLMKNRCLAHVTNYTM